MPGAVRLLHLTFALSEGDDGVATLEALASTRDADAHRAALREAHALLDWLRQQGPGTEGPVDEGGDWDQALERREEPGGWRTVVLTLTGRPSVIDALQSAFVPAGDGGDDAPGAA